VSNLAQLVSMVHAVIPVTVVCKVPREPAVRLVQKVPMVSLAKSENKVPMAPRVTKALRALQAQLETSAQSEVLVTRELMVLRV